MTVKTASVLTTRRWTRWLLLFLILLAFTRLVWRLDAKNLWLDESFSLQRAESSWIDLIRGIIPVSDGVNTVRTIDQHPPAFFLPLGLAVRLLGQSEFALRLPSAAAATLFLPICWALARRLARRGSVPPAAPVFAALLAAVNPFYLWYGQEVRMYAQVGFLALLSLYLLVRWAEAGDRRSQLTWLLGYLVVVLALLSSHYYSVLVLPVQAAVVCVRLIERNRRRALIAAGVFGVGAALVFLAVRPTMMQGGAGSNFASVSPRILGPDLVNAFTLGLSVDLARVWPLDVISIAVAIMGAVWGLRSRSVIARGGWLLPAFVFVPALLLLGLNAVRPAYMNARHMSLISGGYVLLLSAGLAWLWQFRRWLGGLMTTLLVGGMIYSSINYYTAPAYDKGDIAGIGQHLNEKMLPGDLLLIEPPGWGRLFRYYLPIDDIERWQRAGQMTGWRALPALSGSQRGDLDVLLETLRDQYQRIWVARSEPDSEIVDLLVKRGTFRTQDWGFESPFNYLRLELFQVDSPVIDQLPPTAHQLADATFENGISLRGYEVGQPFEPYRAVPITLYWQVAEQSDRRQKYILRWIVRGADGSEHALATTEKEPYDGLLPTSMWTPGIIIREYTSILPPAGLIPGESYLSLQMYDAETLQKSPVRSAAGAQAVDGDTLILSAKP